MEENNAEPFENYYTASSETSKQVQNKVDQLSPALSTVTIVFDTSFPCTITD